MARDARADDDCAEVRTKQPKEKAKESLAIPWSDGSSGEDEAPRDAEGGDHEAIELVGNGEDSGELAPEHTDLRLECQDRESLWAALEARREENLARKKHADKDEKEKYRDPASKMYRCADYDKFKVIVDRFAKKQHKIEEKRGLIQDRKAQLEREDQIQYKFY